MFTRVLSLLLWVFCAVGAWADPKDDASLFLSHFIDQTTWKQVHALSNENYVRRYRLSLQQEGVAIVDPERFLAMLPDLAADEAVEQIKSHLRDMVVEFYGAENLSEIMNFFRTPAGKRMLEVARDEKLFRYLHRQSPRGGPIDRWGDYLSLQERAHFSVFSKTPAGELFVAETWRLRNKVFYEIAEISRWPDAPLNRPYIVDIMKTDGVLQFPNRTLRQSLISELSKTRP